MSDLVFRVDAALHQKPKRLVQFVSASRGEGVTEIASAYARASADLLHQRALLVTTQVENMVQALPHNRQRGGDGNMVAAVGENISAKHFPLIHSLQNDCFITGLPVSDALVAETDASLKAGVWGELFQNFDEIVVDSPPPSQGNAGHAIARLADGIVVVIEAERSREPVVRRFIHDLRMVGANIVGCVLSNRRYYIPQPIYRHL